MVVPFAHGFAGLALALGVGAAGCRGPAVQASGEPSGADAASVARALDERLAALFPEVRGDFSRAAITRALLDAAPQTALETDADVPDAAVLAIRRGDFDRARGLLGELLAKGEVSRARDLLSRGDFAAAVLELDRAVATAPDSPELLILRADAELSIVLERRRGAQEAPPLTGEAAEFAERALQDYSAAARKRGGARAEFGASRAALLLGRTDEALARARTGMDALAGANLALPGGASAESVWAEALVAARGKPNAPDAEEVRRASRAALARDPHHESAWERLVGVESDRNAENSARVIARQALASFPDHPGLHQWLAASVTRSSGRAATIGEYERFTAAHPTSAEAAWTLARERLAEAREELARGRALPTEFARAEAELRRFQAASPERAKESQRAIAEARLGLGFARALQGDLDGARDAFLSVEDVQVGAAASVRAPSGKNALKGLAEIGARYLAAESGSGGPSLAALEKAARVFDYVHEYDRDEIVYATLAASTNRDAAVALEIDARALAAASKTEEANQRLARAKEMMERALVAYRAVLALAPDDPRHLRDAGRVLVDYLQRDPATARGWLERAATIDEARALALKGRPTLDKAEARELEEIESNLSDAYRTLGVLELTLLGEPTSALAWFEKCLATGPDAGSDVRGPKGWLARCKEALASKRNTRIEDVDRWAAPTR